MANTNPTAEGHTMTTTMVATSISSIKDQTLLTRSARSGLRWSWTSVATDEPIVDLTGPAAPDRSGLQIRSLLDHPELRRAMALPLPSVEPTFEPVTAAVAIATQQPSVPDRAPRVQRRFDRRRLLEAA